MPDTSKDSTSLKHFIDPPSGWKYGFPKELPKDTKDVIQWLIDNGYPKEEIDRMGDMFICRHWESNE